MKNLFEYIIDVQLDNAIIKETANIIAEDTINESFKSSIVQKLAQAIYNAEKTNNKRKVADAKDHDERYGTEYGKRDPHVTSFASIFGPKTDGGKYNTKKGLQGLKWSEITDDDFKVYNPDDKELIKLIKKTYGKKDGRADFIVVGKSGEVLNFIKAYGRDPKDDGMFYFKSDEIKTYKYSNGNEHKYTDAGGVKELRQQYYKYDTRPLKANEVLDALKALSTMEGIKVYALEITDDMIKNYNDLIDSRAKAQKGVINYDAASLNALLKQQKARYKVMVAEIKAKRLQKDPNVLFDEIKKCNDEVVELYKQVMSNPENLDKYFDMGRLMSYVSNAYESFYRSMKETREGDKYEKRAKEKGASDERAKDYRSFNDESAKHYINDAEDYVKNVRKMIEEIKAKL